jgi:hypothetical protein
MIVFKHRIDKQQLTRGRKVSSLGAIVNSEGSESFGKDFQMGLHAEPRPATELLKGKGKLEGNLDETIDSDLIEFTPRTSQKRTGTICTRDMEQGFDRNR